MHERYDVIIIGSGAGGSAAAYHLTQTGRRVLLLEKGLAAAADGSTLDAQTVMRRGLFLNDEPWVDRAKGVRPCPRSISTWAARPSGTARRCCASERRSSRPIRAHQCLPVADRLRRPRAVLRRGRAAARRTVPDRAEPAGRLFNRAGAQGSAVAQEADARSGLAPDILDHPAEAAALRRLRFRARIQERRRAVPARARLRNKPNLVDRNRQGGQCADPVTADTDCAIAGVDCEDGTRYEANTVLLACGALHSPRLLQTYLESTGLAQSARELPQVGRNYKFAPADLVLAFSPAPGDRCAVQDHAADARMRFPTARVQTLGGNLAAEIVRTQVPGLVPRWLVEPFARRAHRALPADRRRLASGQPCASRERTRVRVPQIDHDPARLPRRPCRAPATARTLVRQLLSLGYLPVRETDSDHRHRARVRHAGHGPRSRHARWSTPSERCTASRTCYVVDGSVLPRSSRVNPALTIYAWALRVASRLGARGESNEHTNARPDPVRA